MAASSARSGGLTPREGRARYRRIVGFAVRFMAVEWWYVVVLPRLGLGELARRGRTERFRRFAARFRELALELGGLMIKVGQFLSTRLDVLPPEITDELDGLQDEVPAAPFADVRRVAEGELGRPLESAFAAFEPVPVAAASLGQAHRARLTDALAADTGFADVIVKVQRPGIGQIVDIDLAALRRIAELASRVRFVSDRVDAPAIIEEFAGTCREEIDYVHEASNAELFAENAASDARVATPRVAWERSAMRVLTLEDVTAIKVTDVPALVAAGIDPAEVADEVARTTFEQLFVHGFFHADPHPGNLFVTPGRDGSDWTLTYIDFGMMGRVPDTLRAGLTDVVVALVARDPARLVQSYQRVGLLLPGADSAAMEQVFSVLFDRFGGIPVSELAAMDHREMVGLAAEFGDTIRAMPVQLPENFLLIIRAVSLVSGVCTALNPTFNLWTAIEPFASTLVRDESGRALQGLGRRVAATATVLAGLPGRLDSVLLRAERGDLAMRTPDLERSLRQIDRTLRRAIWAVVFAALLVAGALVRDQDVALSTWLFVASVVPLLPAVLPRPRGPHGRP